jgi:transporter family-2 protein
MDNINGAWLYPIILIAGALQAWGPPMNGALRNALTNPWLASIVSFIPVIALLAVLWLCQPRPMPTSEGISSMPWWAPLGGVVRAQRCGLRILVTSAQGKPGAADYR